ncbi:MAG TPA: hypothetical protein VMT03_01115 [Polyangia bacterium]|nr:hypothetical protein [Polyangia bacterium]
MRLRDEGATALERALLDAGTAYRGSPTARAKTLGALGLAGSATLAGAAAARTSLSLGKLSIGKLSLGKIFAGAAIVGAVATVPAGYRALHRQDVAMHAARGVPAPALSPVAQGGGPAVAVAVAPVVPVPDDPSAHAARRARVEPAVPLARELASIDGARAALARGDTSDAIARLDGYARAYPRGRLDQEAEVLRIDALSQSGRAEAARAHAREFLRRHPNSVLAAHVRTRLGD